MQRNTTSLRESPPNSSGSGSKDSKVKKRRRKAPQKSPSDFGLHTARKVLDLPEPLMDPKVAPSPCSEDCLSTRDEKFNSCLQNCQDSAAAPESQLTTQRGEYRWPRIALQPQYPQISGEQLATELK